MAADFNNPTVNSLKASFPGEIRDNVTALAKLDPSTGSNIPTGAKRVNETTNQFERYSGSTWVPKPYGVARRFNAIIGGDFSTNPWQRGTSFTAPANAAYTADRWVITSSGTMVINHLKTADAPTVAQCGKLVTHCLHLDVTTADAAMAASDLYTIEQRIEGYNWLHLAQKACTLSFWVKATKTGTYSVSLRNSGNDRSFVAEYVVNSASTWEYKEIAITASPSAGTWDYTNGIGAKLRFTICGGTDNSTSSLNTWNSDDNTYSTNQVNGADSTSNDFKLALIQLEPGDVATPFIEKTFDEVLQDCQRYFEKTFLMATAPAQNAGGGGCFSPSVVGAATGMTFPVFFKTRKRAAPSMTGYNPSVANAQVRNDTRTQDCSSTSFQGIAEWGCGVQTTTSASTVAGDRLSFNWIADAEL